MKKFFIALIMLAAAMTLRAAEPVKIIFDTDMGNDVDDVVALDMLYKYMDEGKIELLGIISSKREEGSIRFIDAMNTLYGYPNIPIGIVKSYPEENYTCTDTKLNYADYTVAAHQYKHTITDWDAVDDGYKLIRKLLADQPDRSVTFVTVGFSTNMARLLASGADEYSTLDGKSLMAQKADKVVIMAGNFNETKKSTISIKTTLQLSDLLQSVPCRCTLPTTLWARAHSIHTRLSSRDLSTQRTIR